MTIRARVSFLAFLIPATAAFASAALAENVGEATRVQTFAYQTAPQSSKTPLFKLDPVVRNGVLQTVPNGALEVAFTDGSKLTLGSDSTIVVDNYVYSPGGAGSQTLKMTRGLFRFVSGTIPKNQVKLQTPTVTIGIRGTIVKTKIEDDGSQTIYFEHGEGDVTSNDGKHTTPMHQGDMLKVGPDGSFGPPENKKWNAGDEAVDFGMNAFGGQDHGPNGGSAGGDGAGASGGSPSNND